MSIILSIFVIIDYIIFCEVDIGKKIAKIIIYTYRFSGEGYRLGF